MYSQGTQGWLVPTCAGVQQLYALSVPSLRSGAAIYGSRTCDKLVTVIGARVATARSRSDQASQTIKCT